MVGATFTVAAEDVSRRSGEICSAAAGTNRVKALIVRPRPIKDSVKTAAASEIATATIASERFVQRLGGAVRPEVGMLANLHVPFHA